MSARVVAIIPALDAEASIKGVIVALRRAVPEILVIGVDDGSQDRTRTLLKYSCDHLITFDTNQGKGVALRAAFATDLVQEAEAVLTLDADGQHDPAFAPRLLEALTSADLVIGTRDINTITVPPHRRLANLLSTAATRAVTRIPLRDSQSGYRAMRGTVVRNVQARGERYEFETDFLVRASLAGYRIAEVIVPTIYGPPSHFREITDAWRVVRVLWSHRGSLFRPRSKPV